MSADFYSFVSRGEFKKALRCVSLETAARSLAQQCRYNGTTSQFYSVAQHCVLISERWPIGDPRAVWGLLHGLHECVIGDITRPTRGKMLWRAGDAVLTSDELDAMFMREIQRRFDLPPIPRSVLDADRMIVVDEMLQLFDRPRVSGFAKRLNVTIKSASPSEAEKLFVERARKLGVDKLFELQPQR